MLYYNPLRTFALSAALTLPAVMATAQSAPSVVTDIAPIHSLVARVMQGVGEPELLVDPTASPHGYALKPSQAAALQNADLVVWIGHGLTPWLEDPLETLAPQATSIELIELEETHLLEYRDAAIFEDDHDDHHEDHKEDHHEDGHHEDHHKEGHGDPHHEDDAHKEDHGDEAHDDHHKDDHHDEEHHDDDHAEAGGHDDHHHHEGGADAHAWLDMHNAEYWVTEIAAVLSDLDPANAALYQQNAAAAAEELAQVEAQVAAALAGTETLKFVLLHDALQYFEHSFDVPALGSISVGDAQKPSSARLRAVEHAMEEVGATCILIEPQLNTSLAKVLGDATGAKLVEIDFHGAGLTPGHQLYAAMMLRLGEQIATCGS